jgi:hypothetical protein
VLTHVNVDIPLTRLQIGGGVAAILGATALEVRLSIFLRIVYADPEQLIFGE